MEKCKFLRLPQVLDKIGVKRSTLYSWIQAGQFPPPVQLGARAVGWWAHSVDEWMNSRQTANRR